MAVAANVLGSWIAYGVGLLRAHRAVERHGKWLHIKPSHIEWADRWFAKYGDAAVFFSRMLPIIRTFISLPAGVARMPFWRFTRVHGARLHPVDGRADVRRASRRRDNWEDWKSYLHYVDYAVARGDRRRRDLPAACAGAAARGDAADAPAA